jgi:hypothetical protein
MAANKLARKVDYDAIVATDWAYMAGIIEGEGCIRIGMQREVKARRTLRHKLVVYVGNTDPRLIAWCRKMFSGSIHYRPARKAQHKPAWIWEAHHQVAEEVLQHCLPYMQIKREQAEVALAFRDTFRMVVRPRLGIPADIVAMREGYRKSLMDLKDQQHEPIEDVNSIHLGTWADPNTVQ